jgi:hypothetical protein
MARDMNLMRQNITKLVKLQGGAAASRADMFFMKSGERESAYENRFSKAGGLASKTPTQVGAKPEEKKKGIFDYILDFLPTIFKGLLAAGIIGQFLKDPETFKIVKEFATKVLIKFFDGVTATFNVLSDLFNDPEVQKSISRAVNSIIGAIGDFLSISIGKITTPFGELNVTIGGAIAAVVGGFALFKGAMFGTGLAITKLGEAAALAAGRMAVGGTVGGAPGAPGKPGGLLGKIAVGSMLAWGAAEGYVALKNWNWGKGTNLSDKEKKEFSDKTAAELKEKTGLDPTTEDVQQAVEQKLTSQKVTSQKEDMTVRGTALGVATVATGASAISAVSKQVAPVASKIAAAGLEAATKPNSVWGKFLEFVAKKSPRLFASIGYKLAGAGLAATVPGPGWIYAAVQLGMSIITAYELFDLWKQFNNLPSTDDNVETPTLSTSPTPIVEGAGGAAFGMYSKPGMQPNPAPAKYNPAADSQAANITTPTPASYSNEGRTRSTASPSSSGQSSNSSLLDIIAGGESGSMGYDAANKGKAGDMPGGYPGLSKMTVNEVMRLQSEGKVFATGRYQIIPTTLAGLMTGSYGNTGVKGGDLYDASTQDKLVTALINKRLKQGGSDPIEQQYALSQEFASIANPYTGSSYYDKVGNNKASIGTQTIQAALTGTGAPPATVVASASPSTPSSSPDFKMPTMGTLAAAAPTMGDMIEAATSAFSDITRVFDTAMASVTNVTNNNTQASAAGQQSQGNLPSVYDDVFLNLFQRVT